VNACALPPMRNILHARLQGDIFKSGVGKAKRRDFPEETVKIPSFRQQSHIFLQSTHLND
jgi:hypothetical protein